MKNLFTLIAVALLSFAGAFAQEAKTVADAVRYIEMYDGQVIAIPEKYILGEEINNGVCTLSLEGGQSFTYSLANVAGIGDSYAVTGNKLLSFGFTHDENDQVYADVETAITEEGDTVIVDGIIATSQVRISVGGDVENATTDAGRNRGEWGNLWN